MFCCHSDPLAFIFAPAVSIAESVQNLRAQIKNSVPVVWKLDPGIMLLNVGKKFHAGCAWCLSETRLKCGRRDCDLLSHGSTFFFSYHAAWLAAPPLWSASPLDFTLPCILTIFREQRTASDARSTSVSCTDGMSTLLVLLALFTILATHEKHSRSPLPGHGCQDSPNCFSRLTSSCLHRVWSKPGLQWGYAFVCSRSRVVYRRMSS